MSERKKDTTFNPLLKKFYKKNRRVLPWRNITDPYKIWVSEIMLQQTQVSRVIPKYEKFIIELPDIASLASVSTTKLLTLWSGLGYNNRAVRMRQAAQKILSDYSGVFPTDYVSLRALPGIGDYTAKAVQTFTLNIPEIFIETNIRDVFITHFFKGARVVSDKEILEMLPDYIDAKHPREWYYALMDYGSFLKSQCRSEKQKSKHYKKQSPFEGSTRQKRSKIVKLLLSSPSKIDAIAKVLNESKETTLELLQKLTQDNLLMKKGQYYMIA